MSVEIGGGSGEAISPPPAPFSRLSRDDRAASPTQTYCPAAPLNISALTSNLEALRRAVTVVASTPMKPHMRLMVQRRLWSFSTLGEGWCCWWGCATRLCDVCCWRGCATVRLVAPRTIAEEPQKPRNAEIPVKITDGTR